MNISYWLNADLHIHSKKSNDMKTNDYKGQKYSAAELLDTLYSQKKAVNLFSVTDHNVVNVELYDELKSKIEEEPYMGIINYVVGVELDILDTKIYKDKIHALCLFESKDHKAIHELIKSFDLKNEGSINNLQNLFNAINDKLKKKKFILIPHFNNKSKGIPSDLKNIKELTRLMFNAYEDSNNIRNIQKSLSIYLKSGYVDFPFVAFSDCHNLKYYPNTKKKENEKGICSILGNIDYPFDSIKTAFEEPRLRISIHSVSDMRSHTYDNQAVSKIYDDNKSLKFSPALNTIIGPFGSGKSFLVNKMVNGIQNIDDKYADLVDKDSDSFLLEVKGSKYNSLKEIQELKIIDDIIQIEQDEDLFYRNTIEPEYIKKLSSRLGFDVPVLQSKIFDFGIDDLISNLDKFIKYYKKNTNAYSINYAKAFEEQKGYLIKSDQVDLDLKDIVSKILNNKLDLEKHEEMHILDIKLFTEKELDILKGINDLLDQKMNVVHNIEKHSHIIYDSIEQNLKTFNLENDIKRDKDQKSHITQTIKDYSKNLIRLFRNLIKVDNVLTEMKFNTLKDNNNDVDIGDFKIECYYNLKNTEYKPLTKHLYSNVNNEILTQKIFDSIYKGTKLRGNVDFDSVNLRKSLENYQSKSNDIFNKDNLKYDILYDKDNSRSITHLSAGGRAKELLKIAFAKIQNNLDDEKRTIVVVDQPENNMDNDSIKSLVVEKIKEIKLKDNNYLIQFIIITHNANVCITSDSENIIVASSADKNSFEYTNGCIENTTFIKDVCNILEGGEVALKTRAVKYNINILKGMEVNESS